MYPAKAMIAARTPNDPRMIHQRGRPDQTPDAISKDLKKRGFRFVGSTIVYAFMQSVGMVNDHTVECFRHKEVERLG